MMQVLGSFQSLLTKVLEPLCLWTSVPYNNLAKSLNNYAQVIQLTSAPATQAGTLAGQREQRADVIGLTVIKGNTDQQGRTLGKADTSGHPGLG